MEALFSSLDGGDALRQRVLQALGEAAGAGRSRTVDVHIMTFSFTDARVAGLLAAVAADHPNVTIRMIADWSQGGPDGGRQIRQLVDLGLPNLLVRFKKDQPYDWDSGRMRPRWSYRTSRGLLHHKTLGVLVEGEPRSLVCGSYNWTEKAANSYENLLIVTAGDAGDDDLMRSMEWEFEAMWSDGRVTLSPEEARVHYRMILDEYRSDPSRTALSVTGLPAGVDVPLRAMTPEVESRSRPDAAGATIAYSSRSPHEAAGGTGYSEHNRGRRLDLHKPGGATKTVPLTLTTLALDVIARARSGESLKVAMYGLSPRVPEYGALLEAARRGVRVQLLLDGYVGAFIVPRLVAALAREDLPVEVRAGSRMMHQKYVVHPESHTVLTGTANFSTDASARHSEHRIAVRSRPALTARFIDDFDAIWARVSAPAPGENALDAPATSP